MSSIPFREDFKFYIAIIVAIVVVSLGLLLLWHNGIKDNNFTKRETVKACATLTDESSRARCIAEA